MTSKNLTRRLERLEDSLLPANQEQIVFVIIAVDGDGRREDTGIRIPVSTSPECNQERTLVKAIARLLLWLHG